MAMAMAMAASGNEEKRLASNLTAASDENGGDMDPELEMLAEARRRGEPRPPVSMCWSLLRASRTGDWVELGRLLGREDDGDGADQQCYQSSPPSPAPARAPQVPRDVQESPLKRLTYQGDTALHMVAASGDGESFLRSAEVICGRAKVLLVTANNNGDTPLHSAARAGNLEMVRKLVGLSKDGDGAGAAAATAAMLRTENESRETALHEAIRFDSVAMVRELLEEDPGQLVCGSGTSPLYLAVLLGRGKIVEQIHAIVAGSSASSKQLSFSGPGGQTAMHAAVLRGQGTTIHGMSSNFYLMQKGDDHGSTPLHFAASLEGPCDETAQLLLLLAARFMHPFQNCVTSQLLETNPDAAYQPDDRGMFPIHVAASAGRLRAVVVLLDRCPGTAGLQDAMGRTFLHVAVQKRRYRIVSYACGMAGGLLLDDPILNMQDKDGNTAVHLAVQIGDLDLASCLMRNHRVRLNLANNKWQTPRHLAEICVPPGLYYSKNQRRMIYRSLLVYCGAPGGNLRHDHFLEQDIANRNEAEESKKIIESTQILGIGSVLVATVAFAAAIAMPGGYRGDGTPALAGSYGFDAFVVANALAFSCALLATLGLMYAGMASVDFATRSRHFASAVGLVRSSIRSLAVAFALGTYVVLAPVARTTAMATCAFASPILVYANTELMPMVLLAWTVSRKSGDKMWFYTIGVEVVLGALSKLWPYLLIFGLPALLQITK
uniref:PGG domain-containing protein n=1 Tax=Oryza brachyantha TaxID=4533 RepID=J3MW48_ORYBR